MPLLRLWVIDRDAFRPLLADLCTNAEGRGGLVRGLWCPVVSFS